MRRVILDAGPIIALSKVGLLDLIPQLYEQVIVPNQVKEKEVAPPHETRPGSEIKDRRWAIEESRDEQLRREFQILHDLDDGEAEAILIARDDPENSVILIDEERGIRCAKALGLRWQRTGNLLALAVDQGLLDRRAAEQAVVKMRDEGYLDDLAVKKILALFS